MSYQLIAVNFACLYLRSKLLPGTVPAPKDDVLSIFLDQDVVDLPCVAQVISRVENSNAEIKLPVERVADVVDNALLQTDLLLQLHHQLLQYLLVVTHEEDLERIPFSLV